MLRKTRLLMVGCAVVLMLGSIGRAQWGGGMMGGGGIGYGGMGIGSMGFGGGMMGAVTGIDNGAVTVGSDGNLYVLSRVFGQQGQGAQYWSDIQTKLSALNPTNGNTLWSLTFNENWLTRPVQGPDGRLFLVGFSDWLTGMSGGMMYGIRGWSSNQVQDQNAKLYIVDPSSATVIKSVQLDGEVASLPTVAGSGTSYTVYMVAFDTGYNVDSRGQLQGFGREATLYAFDRGGNLKFSLPLQ
ncbi:MAG: hypothetical protein HY644_06540 [Acidobacteria bacterium]|nr:hypothetical protein [Acidobacteriota bacterium]